MTEIGRNIMARRKVMGMTQEELAKKMGYKSKSTINKIENGTNDIPQSKIIKFAEVLETTPAYLMGWDNTQKREEIKEEIFGEDVAAELTEIAEIMNKINKDAGFRELTININKLNPDEYSQIKSLVDLLIQKHSL